VYHVLCAEDDGHVGRVAAAPSLLSPLFPPTTQGSWWASGSNFEGPARFPERGPGRRPVGAPCSAEGDRVVEIRGRRVEFSETKKCKAPPHRVFGLCRELTRWGGRGGRQGGLIGPKGPTEDGGGSLEHGARPGHAVGPCTAGVPGRRSVPCIRASPPPRHWRARQH